MRVTARILGLPEHVTGAKYQVRNVKHLALLLGREFDFDPDGPVEKRLIQARDIADWVDAWSRG